jgi:histidinol phosphatase-like PHP family hydrolase
MYDLHTHSLLSDGELLPSELVRRYKVLGYKAVAITDHVDESNAEIIIPKLAAVAKKLTRPGGIKVIPGAELTHVPVKDMKALVKKVRSLGAKIVVIHGETLVEPVAPGTNRRALNCGIDILSHPGLITLQDAKLAKKNGVYLEITTRRGHAFTNGHVVKMAKFAGAKLLLNSDSHSPDDILTPSFAQKVAQGAGLSKQDIAAMYKNAAEIVTRSS